MSVCGRGRLTANQPLSDRNILWLYYPAMATNWLHYPTIAYSG